MEANTLGAPKQKSRAQGILFGLFLFVFALAHARPGITATAYLSPLFIWLGTTGWLFATAAFIKAAYGVWGFPLLSKRWRLAAIFGAISSIVLLAGSAQWTMWPMIVLDAAILSVAIDSSTPAPEQKKRGILKRIWFLIVQIVAVAVLLYVSAAILSRPWQRRWGASDEEIARAMPGDERQVSRLHLIDHVVTVDAAPEKVWPWLIQLGQDKAGFYSYDWLERAIGMPVHNRYEIRPEWQNLRVGDYVRTYADRDVSRWRVGALEPNRLMFLEGWGPFWLEPTSDGKTRFGVRTDPGKLSFANAPIEVFAFEPVHFLMEEKMLRTIKELAEKSTDTPPRPVARG